MVRTADAAVWDGSFKLDGVREFPWLKRIAQFVSCASMSGMFVPGTLSVDSSVRRCAFGTDAVRGPRQFRPKVGRGMRTTR